MKHKIGSAPYGKIIIVDGFVAQIKVIEIMVTFYFEIISTVEDL